MSLKGKLLSWAGSWALAEATVHAVETVGPFRRVALHGPLPDLRPGDKIQALASPEEVRTWTPIPRADGADLWVFQRPAESPGMRWVAAVQPGDTLRFLGPQRSVQRPQGKVLLLGDETSAAVAAALQTADDTAVVLEVEDPPAVSAALTELGLRDFTLLPRGSKPGAWLAAVDAHADRSVVLTGGGDLVRRARDELRQAGRAVATLRTYWIAGRAGLD